MAKHDRHALILVENLSVPRDRRVWQEATTLDRAGWHVTVICPKGTDADRDAYEIRENIAIHRYEPKPATGSAVSYAREYLWALWKTNQLIRTLSRTTHFDVVHACNPPDLLIPVALPLKRRGASVVFDHHDLVPELYRSRFKRSKDLLYYLSLLLERITFRLADVVVATNDSYAQIARQRGRKRPRDIFVVRNAPDISRFPRLSADVSLKRGRAHLLAYVGVISPQDGVDYALHALADLLGRRDDWHAVFAGDGDAVDAVQQLSIDLGLTDYVEFVGWQDDEGISRLLATADIALSPEPRDPLNDLSTMTKIAEYMLMSCPVVAFDLTESRATAGSSACYAEPNKPNSFADRIVELLDDPERRGQMGRSGRQRVERELSWAESSRHLLSAYDRALACKNPDPSKT